MAEQQTTVSTTAKEVLAQVGRVIVGKDDVLVWVMAAMLANGHILLEDIPGVGKTTMALAFSKVMDLEYNRVQFTPDVLPSDVTGYSVIDQKTGALQYQKGAVLCNLFLADELNRATSRTQSALLEAMEEGQVTVDGTTHRLPTPFIVLATQNPTGAAGTSMLPDSQMDRFTVRLSLGYPEAKYEVSMVMDRRESNPLHEITALMSRADLAAMQEVVAKTHIKEEVVAYIVDLINATRTSENLLRGASPRATLAVTAMSKAMAQLKGRDYVIPEDVREVFVKTVAHRMLLTPAAEGQGLTADDVLGVIVDRVPSPNLR